ncbi:MAG TPA: NRDE family protein, partial [Terriglobales bacterium]|nr:NRDE family protein [Terriglobales bacterium]
PRVLLESPRVVGGRDRRAGGTWLAMRGRDAAVAMLNRRPHDVPRSGPPPEPLSSGGAPLRSRGLLALDAAAAEAARGDDILRAILARAEALSAPGPGNRSPYAPFSLVIASPAGSWLLTHDGSEPPRTRRVDQGWHVLTHEALDDESEPRTRWLRRRLAGFAPESPEAAEAFLRGLLALHTGEAGNRSPAVCLHEGRMRTVSSALVRLARGEAFYAHAEGRPCTAPYIDYSRLLVEDLPRVEEEA